MNSRETEQTVPADESCGFDERGVSSQETEETAPADESCGYDERGVSSREIAQTAPAGIRGYRFLGERRGFDKCGVFVRAILRENFVQVAQKQTVE